MAAPQQLVFPAGHRIAGRYRLDYLLGQGGMGVVYAAFDEQLGRHVALKLLLSTHASNRQVVERFEREARAAASIEHPGVVEIYGQGSDQGHLYLVMARLRGESLDSRIERVPQQPFAFVARVGADLCSVLAAAHAKGIVHRDLKPSNVFLAEAGDYCDIVKVLDFGVAKLREAPQLTASGQVFGTLAYMPPEQLESAARAEPASDLYAVGCILYEMLTSKPPFAASGQAALTMAILHDQPRRVAELRADAPPALCAIVERALQKEPSRRFGSALDMQRALYDMAEILGEVAPQRKRPQGSAPAGEAIAGAPLMPQHSASAQVALVPTQPPLSSHGVQASAALRTNAWNVAEVERAQHAPDSGVHTRSSRRLMLAGALGMIAFVILAVLYWAALGA